MSICVHGLGYVGLATAALFANSGHAVTGVDVDDDVVARLQNGDPDLGEPALEAYVDRALNDGLDVRDRAMPADYHLVCVPTPYDAAADEADLSCVEQAGRTIAGTLRAGDVVVLESTVPPGTTVGAFRRQFETAALEPDTDFHLGYSPETVMPGNTVEELRTNDRLVGGVDAAATDAIAALYEPVIDGTVHRAPDATTAEFVKVAQNAARDVEIAYANTLALLANDHDVDVRPAIELANEHPRVDILDPGPGVGGHCLPVDPLFLCQDSVDSDLLDAARTINDRMPEHVVDVVLDALDVQHEATVAVLGVTYKGNVAETRNSPGLAIARHLDGVTEPPRSIADGGRPGVDVRIHDPRATDATLDLQSFETAVADADALAFAAAHDEYADLDPERVGDALRRRLVVDPVNVLDADRWTRHGFDVLGL